MISARFIAVAFGLSLACAFAQEAEAHGLKQGECKPFAEMLTALKAEGQKDFIHADKWTESPSSRPLYIITSDEHGEGYELVGNRFNYDFPTRSFNGSNIPERLCIRAQLIDIRLHDSYSRTVPETFYVPGNLTIAEAHEMGERLRVGSATDHNFKLGRAASTYETFPALQARIKIEGKHEQQGPRLTILLDTAENRIGSANNSLENGFLSESDVLGNIVYTGTALDLLKKGGPRIAALTP